MKATAHNDDEDATNSCLQLETTEFNWNKVCGMNSRTACAACAVALKAPMHYDVAKRKLI